jgi:phosphoribosylanthranilate isomerase
VLLFVNPSPEDVQAACIQVPGATLQFHGNETPEFCLKLQHTLHLPFLKAARIPLGGEGKAFDLLKYASLHSAAQALLLDAHVEGYGGGGQAFDWSLLPQNVNAHLVLSGGLNAANVTEGIRQLRPKCLSLGVDVSSGVEAVGADGLVQKGLKDAEKIVQFVAAVRAADLHP